MSISWSRLGFLRAAGRLLSLTVAIAVLAISLAAVVALGLFAVVSPPSFNMAVSITDGIAQPDTTVALRVTGPGSAISGVTLWERVVDADGTPVAERAVPVALEVVSTRTWPWESEYRLVSADGGPLLRYNARYQLFAAAQLLDLTVAGLDASKVERSYEFATLDTPAPLLSPEPVRLEPGKAIPLRWSQPVERLDYEIWPPAQTTLRRDAADSRLWWLQFHDYVQGRDYEVRLTGAEAANGTTLEAPVAFKASSPPGIAVESITPKDGAINVNATTRLTVTFSAPIDEADRAAAQAAITIEPPVRGTFVWEQPDQVVFVPAEKLPPSERMTLRVRGGADGVRAQNGGFLAGDVAATFTTRTNKRIDVNLSKQMLYLYEGDKLVFSTVTSTGVLKSTPTGTFTITYKIPMTDMRGTDPFGRTYHVPNVPWVLPFQGDYTIHAVYWRDVWGRPASAGCVGLPVPIAEKVYKWTPIGTTVTIHY